MDLLANIDIAKRLVAEQFPEWKDLEFRAIQVQGNHNWAYQLGSDKVVKFPKDETAVLQLEKELVWLPQLEPKLPIPIPKFLGLGQPMHGFPAKWAVYNFVEGRPLFDGEEIGSHQEFARSMAEFLNALKSIDTTGGPTPGEHSYEYGGPLSAKDASMREAMQNLEHSNQVDVRAIERVWNEALELPEEDKMVWTHGDMCPKNIIMYRGKISTIIDFGNVSVGDGACDLLPAWRVLRNGSRELFRETLGVDENTWQRARAWTLQKYVRNFYQDGKPKPSAVATINEILKDGTSQ